MKTAFAGSLVSCTVLCYWSKEPGSTKKIGENPERVGSGAPPCPGGAVWCVGLPQTAPMDCSPTGYSASGPEGWSLTPCPEPLPTALDTLASRNQGDLRHLVSWLHVAASHQLARRAMPPWHRRRLGLQGPSSLESLQNLGTTVLVYQVTKFPSSQY